MSELYSITGATLRGIADAIRQKLRISEPVDAGRFDEYVAAFPTREMLDIQYDQNGTMLLVQEGLATLIPPDGAEFTEISWRVLVNGEQVYSDGAMGLCGAETTFDLLRRYEPFGGETVKIRAVYDLRRVGSASPDGREAVIDSAPVVLGWTLHPLKNQSLTVTENGTYIPNAGYTGFDSVTVNVAGGQESEAKEKRYVFENEHVEPFRGDTDSPERYTVSGNVTGLAAGTMLYVECNGQPYGYFTLDAQSIEEMGSGYCDIEFLPNLYYGVDFDAMGSAGWHWAGEEAVQLSLYYLRAAEVDTGGAACLHSANGYTVFLDGSGSVHLAHEENALETGWTVEIVDAESGATVERGSAASGNLRYVTALAASGRRAYARVKVGASVLQTNTVFYP